MIKRYHEAPLCMFDQVQKLTDGDYALVHLFEENEQYLDKFRKAVAEGRDVLLDNSIFELGTAFNGDAFAEWVIDLKPTWYIVPDSWKNGTETAKMFKDFISRYGKLPGKRIGVAQGYSVSEVAACYKQLEPSCDMIAFNLDFSSIFYDSIMKNLGMSREYKATMVPYCVAMSFGRFMVLRELYRNGVINKNKPHHLLGCGLPQEVQWYPSSWNWIRSIDTSNPVIAGIEGWAYDVDTGINRKSDKKLFELINLSFSSKATKLVLSNIKIMKEWCTTWKK